MTNVTEEGRKRRELANFLRNRREKIKDIPKSFLGSSRRRTPGLRREEVAELAGVGSAWYTWLEQARDIQPSSEVLDRIGEALRLTLVEKRHLFCLAGKPIPSNFLTTVPALPESVKSFVENAIQAPALVLGEKLDMLCWNQSFSRSIVDPEFLKTDKRNWLYHIFCNEEFRDQVENWETHAKLVLGIFRTAVAEKMGSPWVHDLISRIENENKNFSAWWKQYEVEDRNFAFSLKNSKQGTLHFKVSFYSPLESPGLRLVIFLESPQKQSVR